ncbi:MAG: hypothetical protein JNL11_12870 [Bdellovibrionaceae bacterium]|nr:hypothetical protein [Pseudobdellovibrionaceae bacterium]
MNIVIIFDRNFGIKLLNTPLDGSVWICESPANARSVEQLAKNTQGLAKTAITTFAFEDEDEATDTLMDILYDVTLHHQWIEVDVYGIEFEPSLKAEIDFTLKIVFDKEIKTEIKTHSNGFKIKKSMSI